MGKRKNIAAMTRMELMALNEEPISHIRRKSKYGVSESVTCFKCKRKFPHPSMVMRIIDDPKRIACKFCGHEAFIKCEPY